MLRRFRNIHPDAEFVFPSHGVAIPPGGEGEVDMPREQRCPDGLVEITRDAGTRRKGALTEPLKGDLTEPSAAATVTES